MADLQELQNLVGRVRRERGFTMDPLRIFTLLNEEIGEVARELKRTWSPNYEPFSKQDLADEIADVLVCLLALANHFEIDVEKALTKTNRPQAHSFEGWDKGVWYCGCRTYVL